MTRTVYFENKVLFSPVGHSMVTSTDPDVDVDTDQFSTRIYLLF